jgi:hypothetical protein
MAIFRRKWFFRYFRFFWFKRNTRYRSSGANGSSGTSGSSGAAPPDLQAQTVLQAHPVQVELGAPPDHQVQMAPPDLQAQTVLQAHPVQVELKVPQAQAATTVLLVQQVQAAVMELQVHLAHLVL